MTRRSLLLILSLAAAVMAATPMTATAQSGQQSAPTRGEMLYGTHCIECHNSQVHWRERQQARDWATLRTEVNRWQAAALLGWSDADIDEVTRHLNDTIYRFALPRPRADASGAAALP